MSDNNDDAQIVNRFIADDDFRARLLADPAGTLQGEGLTASDDLLQKLQNADKSTVDNAVRAYKSGAKNSTC